MCVQLKNSHSQGSAASDLRQGGSFNSMLLRSPLLNATVKEL